MHPPCIAESVARPRSDRQRDKRPTSSPPRGTRGTRGTRRSKRKGFPPCPPCPRGGEFGRPWSVCAPREILVDSGAMMAILCAVLALAVQVSSQDHRGQYSAIDIEAGSRLYAGQCALCHGPNGDLVAAVDLRRGRFRRAASDEDLGRIIRTGIPDAGMPGFALQPSEVDGLIAFIRAGFDVSAA